MALVEITVPAVGESVTEVTLHKWVVTEGQTVKVDASLVECECDKANFDIPAPSNGTLVKILKLEGKAGIGEVIAHFESALMPAPAPIPTPVSSAPADGRLPPQEWGILLQEAIRKRYRETGKYLPLFWWKDGKLTDEEIS